MFPLFSKKPPASADELRDQLNASLERALRLRAPAVQIDAPEFPRIETLAISLDGAAVQPNPQQPNFSVRDRGREILVQLMTITGRDVDIRGATADLNLKASGVRLVEATNSDGEIVLLFDGADSGRVEASAPRSAIEALIETFAKQQAGAHGVSIERVELDLQQRGERSIAAEVRLRARKLFVAASIRITAQLDLDETLNARLSNLKCYGEGPFGSIACGMLSPHLDRANGMEFPLSALPFAQLRVQDVQIAVGDRVAVTAEFAGS
ncbi:MAG: hypothetical protein ACJ8I9_01545 [Chthoniobacterales bacterium]